MPPIENPPAPAIPAPAMPQTSVLSEIPPAISLQEKKEREQKNDVLSVVPQMPAFPMIADPTPQYSLLKVISDMDRTIGSLHAQIAEFERQLVDRNAQSQSLDERINGAQLECKHLQLDVEFHQQKLEEIHLKNQEMEDIQRRLIMDLEEKYQKLRHASVDMSTTCSSAMSGQ